MSRKTLAGLLDSFTDDPVVKGGGDLSLGTDESFGLGSLGGEMGMSDTGMSGMDDGGSEISPNREETST
jgi:hypothetical protein